MTEYIEREALLKDIEEERPENWTDSETERQAENDFYKYREIVEIQPTADVVEVVRCKDCQFFKRDTDYCKKRNKGYCYWDNTIKTRTHFCSYGEKKEGAEE